MVINVNKGPKVKIGEIVFEGREKLKTKVLERALKNTKSKKIYRFWKKSRYKKEDFDEDLKSLVDAYAEKGYRDARVIKDSVYPISDELIGIHLKLQEGNQYYFGDIDFVGNTVYSDRELNQLLGIPRPKANEPKAFRTWMRRWLMARTCLFLFCRILALRTSYRFNGLNVACRSEFRCLAGD